MNRFSTALALRSEPQIRIAFGLLLGFLLLGIGCGKTKVAEDDWATISTMTAGVDHAINAVDFAGSDRDYERNEYEDKIVTNLNRWSTDRTESAEDEAWKLDPMVADLDQQYRDLDVMKQLEDKVFNYSDAQYLRQASWYKSIVAMIDGKVTVNVWPPAEPVDYQQQNEDDDPLALAIQAKHSGMDLKQAQQLADCLKYFDWTVRTIQLEKLNVGLTQEEIDRDKMVLDAEEGTPFPLLGIYGPGYRYFPWQTLLYGHGDQFCRARVFMGLCHQKGIDTIILATKKGDKIEPWLPGAIIGDQIYLFDTELGLAIPGKDGKVATLADVKADPSILNSLDLTVEETLEEDRSYRVKTSDLNSLVGLIDASPGSLSRRMNILERTLSGEKQMVLSVSPSRISESVKKLGVETCQLWEAPFQVHQYRKVFADTLKRSQFDDRLRAPVTKAMGTEVFVDNYMLFKTAKIRFLQGLFDTPRGSTKYSCIRLMSDMRYTEDRIINVTNDEFILSALNVRTPDQSSAEYTRRINQIRVSMRQIRVDAAYFLGVANFEAGTPSTAINWLGRVDDFKESGRWDDGIRYVTARSHEWLGDYGKAIELYKADKSPQMKGNLLRVRMLQELEKETAKSKPE